jgi:hypothetical protein
MFKLPTQEIIDIIDVPLPYVEFPSPDNAYLLLARVKDIHQIEELARPFMVFAGMRVTARLKQCC